jgi:hypothetical protein
MDSGHVEKALAVRERFADLLEEAEEDIRELRAALSV